MVDLAWFDLLSQGLLWLGCVLQLFLPGLDDVRLISLLVCTTITMLMNLLSDQSWLLYGSLLLYTGLCLIFPHMLLFWPVIFYICMHRVHAAALLGLLALSLLYRQSELSWHSLAWLLAAPLLRWKDMHYSQLRLDYFRRMDDSSEKATRQQQAISALQREQETGIKLALSQERNRIARDIHDSVGHILSRSILQLTAMELSSADPEQRQQMSELKASLTEGMNAVRRSVHNTRQEQVMLDQEIRALIERFQFCPVHYVNRSSSELSLQQKYVVMSAITEALNNVMRHSSATKVDLSLSQAGGSHILLIRDNGSPRPSQEHMGLGLSAMEERVRGLGGSMIVSAQNGFRILITLPQEDAA